MQRVDLNDVIEGDGVEVAVGIAEVEGGEADIEGDFKEVGARAIRLGGIALHVVIAN